MTQKFYHLLIVFSSTWWPSISKFFSPISSWPNWPVRAWNPLWPSWNL